MRVIKGNYNPSGKIERSKTMKRFLAIALTAAMGLLYSADSAMALGDSGYTANEAAGGIVGSRHNLGAFGMHVITATVGQTTGTTEVCVFCHTPHHGGTHAPLWNKGVQSYTSTPGNPGGNISFTMYSSPTLIGAVDSTPGAATLACLSCHDGVSTFDTLVNAPGKGNNGNNNTTKTNFTWTFSEMPGPASKADYMSSTRLNIGTTLANDHPVSVVYTETTAASLRTKATTITGINLAAGLTTTNNNITQNLWAVKGYLNAGATIQDLLKTGDKVECSSCHDPHFSNKSWDEVDATWGGEAESDGMFLRRNGGNTGSGVCRTCHNK